MDFVPAVVNLKLAYKIRNNIGYLTEETQLKTRVYNQLIKITSAT